MVADSYAKFSERELFGSSSDGDFSDVPAKAIIAFHHCAKLAL